MPTNKQAQIRYQTLDRCFSNFGRRYYIEDLMQECNKALFFQAGIEKGVQIRQIRQDISDMETIWDIPLCRRREGKKVYYHYNTSSYSINNQLLNEMEVNQLKETIYMLNRFKGMPQFTWMEEILARIENDFNLRQTPKNIVAFEQNPYLKGLNLFSDIFNAIVNKQTLTIVYQRFFKEKKQYIFHPYFLKQYNNRWFLFGLCHFSKQEPSLIILALDRIEKISYSNEPYIENNDINFDEYFEDVIGVSVYNKQLEKVVLEIDNVLFPYVHTKPLHGSQKIKSQNEETTTIELSLIINYEAENLFLSYIDKIKIVSPIHLREKMLIRLKEAMKKNQ
ncbi:MAG: WYL domain-containing protein [Bacteroidales bacterium]|nr:WYL domain-containing protein [Bacteroidales bacterium]